MASGILTILDDIAMLMDDTAAMTKVAAKKTAGLLGDDLAVNAEKATGFHASRELPVIWAITKGSFVNKLIILPLAFLLSAFAPWLIVPILLIGGVYLSYEGAEKILEWIISFKNRPVKKAEPAAKTATDKETLLAQESSKIKAAIRTDFILSIEIIILALETVIEQSFSIQVMVVSIIALIATIGVYGLVALLVRMDDTGLSILEKSRNSIGWIASLQKNTGQLLIAALPKIIRMLTIIGTLAMLLVGGGMFVHNIEFIHHLFHGIPSLLAELFTGMLVGSIAVIVMLPFHKKKH
jgi:predicted DNA repair protein MutK